MKNLFLIEKTETLGGEANYSWVRRVYVRATSPRGAINKARKHWTCGGKIRKTSDCGDMIRWDVDGAAICYFCVYIDESQINTTGEII
jgi:hypothetical protein